MHRRHLVVIVATALIAVGIALWMMRSTPGPGETAPSKIDTGKPAQAPGSVVEVDRSTLADGLNDPGGTIEADLGIVSELFTHWITNFPRAGNPVGSNAEITAALAGRNALGLELLPRDHPAINARRELVDRWSTPFRFHQWSGSVMEIISAGPDRAFATDDDRTSISAGDEHPSAIVR